MSDSGDPARAAMLEAVRNHLRRSAEVRATLPSHSVLNSHGARRAEAGREPDAGELVAMFRERLAEVGGRSAVARDTVDAAEHVRRILAESGARRVAWSNAELVLSIRGALQGASLLGTDAGTGAKDDLLACDAGVSSAQWGVAETGSLVLESRAELHRRVSLLPPVHIALLPVERLLPTIADALGRLRGLPGGPSAAITFITGPSRTADIELTLVIGVHGPRELHVVLIQSYPMVSDPASVPSPSRA